MNNMIYLIVMILMVVVFSYSSNLFIKRYLDSKGKPGQLKNVAVFFASSLSTFTLTSAGMLTLLAAMTCDAGLTALFSLLEIFEHIFADFRLITSVSILP